MKRAKRLNKYLFGGEVPTNNVEAEGGEVVQTPDGTTSELEGPSHAEGGIDLSLPEGSVIFSDKLGIKGRDGSFKTLAERKKDRDNKILKASKGFKNGYGDLFARNTAKRILNNAQTEEESDLRFQDGVNRELGTGEYEEGKVKAEFGMGTALGLAAQIGGSFANASNTEQWMKTKPTMPNFYRNYGLSALTKFGEMKNNLLTYKANAMNLINSKLRQKEQNQAAQINGMGGGLNLRRALRTASKLSVDNSFSDAISGLEGDYSNKLTAIAGEEANLLNERDKMVGLGNTSTFKDMADNHDAYFAAKSKNTADTVAGIANIGTQMNNSSYQDKFMNTLTAQRELIYGKPTGSSISSSLNPTYSDLSLGDTKLNYDVPDLDSIFASMKP